MKIAYQGEPGAFSDEAVTALFPDGQATGFPTFRLTFDALEMGAVDAAVLPVENSSAGVVQEVSDLLWELPGLRIVRDHVQPVRHCLLGWPGPVERALSHPQALAQCERYLHSRQIRPVTFHDTAGAARAVESSASPARRRSRAKPRRRATGSTSWRSRSRTILRTGRALSSSSGASRRDRARRHRAARPRRNGKDRSPSSPRTGREAWRMRSTALGGGA